MPVINQTGNALTGSTGSGTFVGANTPTLITPVLGAATATSINFGGSSLANYVANTSWTPVFTFATPGDISVAYTTQAGSYIRVGNLVIAKFNLLCTPTFTTSSGAINITGLPVSTSADSISQYGVVVNTSNVIYTAGSICLSMGSSTSTIRVVQNGTAFNNTTLTTTSVTSTLQIQFQGTISYFA